MAFNLSIVYSSRHDNWATPKNIYEWFSSRGYKDFNPLQPINFANSLVKDYDNYFCNPPFSNIFPFVDYMIKCHGNGYSCVLLLPIRLNTLWFKKLVEYGCDIIILGRIKYSDKGFAPFDSFLIFPNGIRKCSIRFDKQFKNEGNVPFYQFNIFNY